MLVPSLKIINIAGLKVIPLFPTFLSSSYFFPTFYAPNLEKVGDILDSACPYVCLCVCMYSCSRYRLETSCMVVLCRLSPAIENLSPWLKIADNRLKLFTIDCRNSVMVPSFSETFGSFAVG